MQKLKAALIWIVNILKKNNIPYQITGGLAAHIYGATRPINDIDIDIPDDAIYRIKDDVKEYLIEGPMKYKDDKWDLNLLSLNYKGQEIDLGGALETRIFDETTHTWVPSPANLNTAKIKSFLGLEIKVVDPHDLIKYKELLGGDHQKQDIREIRVHLKMDR